MSYAGTIIFVHGTGVRIDGFAKSFAIAQNMAAAANIEAKLVGCVWGDALGVEYKGLSLPDPPTPEEQQRADQEYACWSVLFADPLFELDRLTLPDPDAPEPPNLPPGRRAEWEELWDRIAAYHPSLDFAALLERGQLGPYWPEGFARVTRQSEIPRLAFERSFRELPEACCAMARALVAELHVTALAAGSAGPSLALRQSLVDRLIADWGQQVYGLGTFFTKLFGRFATRWIRSERSKLSAIASLPVGDVLLYQARGAEVRNFIRAKIEAAEPPVTLLAHSLGGIACVELLALPDAPRVEGLVTIGSQAPLLYEIGALAALKRPQPLPPGFPRWLNVYDRNDFLSFVAGPLLPGAEDFEAISGQPFPDSHSAYIGDDRVWKAIADMLMR